MVLTAVLEIATSAQPILGHGDLKETWHMNIVCRLQVHVTWIQALYNLYKYSCIRSTPGSVSWAQWSCDMMGMVTCLTCSIVVMNFSLRYFGPSGHVVVM